jgi:hypothetical protein
VVVDVDRSNTSNTSNTSASIQVLVDVDRLGERIEAGDHITVDVMAHGPTRIVRVAPVAPHDQDPAAAPGEGSVGSGWQGMMARSETLLRRCVRVQLAGVGLSVLDGALSEVR